MSRAAGLNPAEPLVSYQTNRQLSGWILPPQVICAFGGRTAIADIRILLSDKAIAHLPAPKDGWYLARDTELKGFFVAVGKRKKTFTVQGDLRWHGKRASSMRVAIGDTSEISTRSACATAKDYLAQISRGQHPKAGAQPAKAENAGNKALAIGEMSHSKKRRSGIGPRTPSGFPVILKHSLHA